MNSGKTPSMEHSLIRDGTTTIATSSALLLNSTGIFQALLALFH
jgi:hypothetical protein